MRIIFRFIAALLLFQGSIVFADNTVENVNTNEWPIVSIDYNCTVSSMHNLYLTISGVDKKVSIQNIQKVHNTKQKNILIAIDASRSLTQQYLSAIKFSLHDYVKHISEDHAIALLSFNDAIQLHSTFTKDKKQLINSLELIKQGGGKTELYRTIDSAISLLETQQGERTLLIVTDGHDEGSVRNTAAIIKKAMDSNVLINVVGLPDKGDKNEVFLNTIKKFADETKGSYAYCASPLALSSAVISILNKPRTDVLKKYRIRFDLSGVTFQNSDNVECLLIDMSEKTTRTTKFSITLPKSAITLPKSADTLPKSADTAFKIEQNYIFIGIAAGIILLLLCFLLLKRKKTVQSENMSSESRDFTLESRDFTLESGDFTLESGDFTLESGDFSSELSDFSIEFSSIGMTFPLLCGRVTIGASKDNAIVLEDPTVSRHHAVLEITNDKCKIEDLHSTNGIYVNERRISRPVFLQPGDRLYFGKSKAVLKKMAPASGGDCAKDR